jgi:DNA-binding Xre family transcriptional regulator
VPPDQETAKHDGARPNKQYMSVITGVSGEDATPAGLLKKHRIRSGMEPHALAKEAGMSDASYFDMEEHEDEIMHVVSVETIRKICHALEIQCGDLFRHISSNGRRMYKGESLAQLIVSFLTNAGMKIDEFESDVGYELKEALADEKKMRDWNIDCLRSVCDRIGVDWRYAVEME